ncbi:MAG TPA: class I SAM-dependent methyltransferase [Syntrophales bacterium]|nr:class I SAM-dependent methyltransferase [Syntrophales bacterium]
MSSSLADHFALFSKSYDRVNHVLSLGLDVHWRERLVASVERRPTPNILDLCAGTLPCTRTMLQRFSDARVMAVDFCHPMLELGRANIPLHMRSQVEIICADALDLNLPSASFDVVVSCFGMRHLEKQEEMLKKIRGWLLPGGQFLIFDFFRPATPIAKLFQATVGRYVLPSAARFFGGFASAYTNLHVSIERFLTRQEYEGLLVTEGYVVTRSEDMAFGVVSIIVAAPL